MHNILQNKSKLGLCVMSETSFSSFCCYKRKWNQSSVTLWSLCKPKLAMAECNSQIPMAGGKRRTTVCTVPGEIRWNEAVKLLKNLAPNIYKPLRNPVEVRVAPTETMQPFSDRQWRSCLQAWVMRHRLPIKIPAYCAAEVSLWLMEPMCVHNVSLQVSRCQTQTQDCG